MTILFLDLSTKSTGWCVANNKKLTNYGCFSASGSNVLARIAEITDNIENLIKQYKIDKIVAEEVRTDYKNVHTYKVLNWIQGITLYRASLINPKIQYEFIQASTWRSTIGIRIGAGIKRETLKQEDIKYVERKYAIKANDDVCDAICLMDAYYSKTEQVEGIDWS